MTIKPIQEAQILDFGKVALLEVMGNDKSIVNAARVSYADTSKHFRKDHELINYLMRHRHNSPFEQVEFKFYVKAPIFIARQWMRYRAASYAELSGRYSELGEDYYLPSKDRLESVKRAGEDGVEANNNWLSNIIDINNKECASAADCLSKYLPNELANRNHNLFKYTEFYYKVDLHNLFNMLQQRLDTHAQWEFRQYAEAIMQMIEPIVPFAVQAFKDYRLNAITFSAKEIELLKQSISIKDIFNKPEGMTKGEYKEFETKLEKFGAFNNGNNF